MRIGIIGYYGFNNFGDELNLKCMLRDLRKQYDNAEFVVFSDCERPEGTVDYPIICSEYFSAITDSLNKCDLLILGGGGLIYLGEFWFSPLLDCNIPYIIYRIGIDDREISPSALEKHRRLFQCAGEVTVRDSYSLNLCRKHLTEKARLVPEAIWNHPYHYKNVRNHQVRNIGINLRSFSAEIYPILKTFFQELRRKGYRLYFIPCQLSERNPYLNDNTYHRELAAMGDTIMPDESTLQERCKLISEMDFCIGMRLHFLLVSFSQRVPAIALNYNNKVAALMDEVGLSDYTVELSPSKLHRSLELAFGKLIKDDNKIIEHLVHKIPKMEESAKIL